METCKCGIKVGICICPSKSSYNQCEKRIRQEERERAQKIIENLDTNGVGHYTNSVLRMWKQEAIKKLNEMNNSQVLNLYIEATQIARNSNQTAGEKNDYYITLAQLENLIYKYES